jgi:LytS/YehU family sensor histidine kinase
MYYEEGLEEYKSVIVRILAKSEPDIDRNDKKILLCSHRKLRLSNIFWIYGQRRILQELYDSLYVNYRRIGDLGKALEYHLLADEIGQEFFKDDYRNTIAAMEADSENEKVQNQIAVLEKDMQLNEIRAGQARNTMIGIGILFLVMVSMGLMFLRQNKLKNEFKSNILEQKLLRIQMNPHFMFNALSNIHNLLVQDRTEKASDYLVSFSQLLRNSLESSREDHILLEEEINILRNYLELQQLRYDNKFDFSIETDPDVDTENAIIPPMLIQPFIENAIEHGIKHKEGKGHIITRFKLVKNRLVCEVEDDGIGRQQAWETEYSLKKEHKSLATEIIMDRIKILNTKFRQKINLSIIDKLSDTEQPLGTLVRLELPYMLD